MSNEYIRPTQLKDWQRRVLQDIFGYAPWHPVLPTYEAMWRDREHLPTAKELDRIHDAFAKARLRGNP